ncbi:cytochrome P450 [Neorhizobium galegae]|uniref:Fatty acid alpha hydroxylase n=1 Tax=Neorhizobium galegae bv. officinalis TaxID=323656 RepID=A0A0T7GWG3_NEOGA|nr:cytochrome P450 [Neorhizobium galegae]CDZ51631.1 Fatty acid alpha hydroxylase [Neorhizobium galegae bv. officinalis]
MAQIPFEKNLDSTLALIGDPYRFISDRCRRHRSDLFETRFLLQRTICMTGPEAARLFYDPDLFVRKGAMPKAIQKTLLGEGGVQGLDGGSHRHRKQMFMSLMSPEQIGELTRLTAAEWQARMRMWASRTHVLLYPEFQRLLTRASCAWVGIPLADPEVDARTRDIVALFDHAGSLGVRHLWSRWSRKRADRWLANIVEEVRSGRLHAPEHTAAHAVAWHRNPDGELLTPHVAAVELLNVIRPIVAVSVYMIFVAHALHMHADVRDKLRSGDDDYANLFVQEVRRYYPFFPAVAARARQAFEWNGYHFPEGRRVILDLFGTNQNKRTWEKPEEFEPDRFRQWDGSPFNFIPQGGGSHYADHRCPGEWITTALMKQATNMLTQQMAYDVPEQDLQIEWSRMPALPRSRFAISNIVIREKP